MRRSLFALVAVLVLGMAACSSDDGGQTTAATGGETGTTTGPTGPTAATGSTTGTTGADGCTEATATDLSAEPTYTVTIADFAFDPACFIASATASFEVVNQDGAPHTWTVDGEPLDISVDGGGSFGSIGATPGVVAGTFGFFCRIHPTMTGTVIFV